MDKIRNSFWGYNKNDVRNLIFEKDQIIYTQQKDIDYLRSLQNQQTAIKEKIAEPKNIEGNSNRFLNLEQSRLEKQMEME